MFNCCLLLKRGPGPMIPPPSGIPPNFALPPPGFPPPFSSDGVSNGTQVGQGQSGAESNQELWVETKAADGKVFHHDLLH